MNVKVAKDALEKARKAELVQKQIQEHLQKINFTKNVFESTTPLGGKKLVFDSLGRILDEAGNVVKSTPVIHSTLKVNRNLVAEKQKKEIQLEKSEKIAKKVQQSQYVDPSLNNLRRKRKKLFNFVEPGTYIKQERQLLRQMEERASGINKSSLIIQKKRLLEQQNKRLSTLNNRLENKDTWDDDEPFVEWWDRGVIVLKSGEDPFKLQNLKKHQYITNIDLNDLKINEDKFNHYIEHPVKLDGKRKKGTAQPLIQLTKKERKKFKRLRKQEKQRIIRDKITIGMIPPPPPKLKLSNLINVLKNQSAADPSKVEQQVKHQMEQRLKAHEQRNEERKLTKEQRSKKKAQKWQIKKNAEAEAALFTINSLSNFKLIKKIDTNAQQFHLSGTCIIMNNGPAFLIIEGSKLSIRRYTKLLLRRIKWTEYILEGDLDASQNSCKQVWVGNVKKRSFPHWTVNYVDCDEQIEDILKPFKALHYFEMVQKYRDPLEDV
ncbi:U4/U6-associated splicing factor [Theileria orientalis strain Shintoku]|uniref:U4/U6-associated splicing factor n=1 Tax=Theileria orientalis strain Shintoku TaxID=869250 RepID=J4DAT0_THEOR|nr:U4/U6-associated splicing factor [Theileria orientalis strain Shintoku]BAM42170.1 U4/U6-associated splicing factor [Theileria orientalis strain Shintoku]|eukprot:XP_009692471.1 U4/U6-associated splicing factor [Theileria orientalis strain Shintoku]